MENRKSGFRWLKVLLAILTPLALLLLLVAGILKMAGLDPVTEARNLLFGRGTAPEAQNDGGSSAQMDSLKKQISAQAATIDSLRSESDRKSGQIDDLNNRLAQAENQSNQADASMEDTQAVYAQTFKNMDPAKAAAIFNQMDTRQAGDYINMLDNKTKAAILENMTPEKAAALTPMLKPLPSSGQTDSTGTNANGN